MKGIHEFLGQVMVQIAVLLLIQLFLVFWGGRPDWVVENISCDFLYKACVCLLLFCLFFMWKLAECIRKFGGVPQKCDFDMVNPPGVYRHKKQQYDCCPRCFVGDGKESVMVRDFDVLKCPVCGLQL